MSYTLIKKISEAGAKLLEADIDDLKSKDRDRKFVTPRHMIMSYLAERKDKLNITLKEIGDFFGKRDHSTVIHAKKSISDLSFSNQKIKDDYKSLCEKLDDIIKVKSYSARELIDLETDVKYRRIEFLIGRKKRFMDCINSVDRECTFLIDQIYNLQNEKLKNIISEIKLKDKELIAKQ